MTEEQCKVFQALIDEAQGTVLTLLNLNLSQAKYSTVTEEVVSLTRAIKRAKKYMPLKIKQPDNDTTLCGKYRLMILRLLDNGHETNIPQEVRDAAYDLLNEYFDDGEDQTIEKGKNNEHT